MQLNWSFFYQRTLFFNCSRKKEKDREEGGGRILFNPYNVKDEMFISISRITKVTQLLKSDAVDDAVDDDDGD